jgi:hypothetical protein
MGAVSATSSYVAALDAALTGPRRAKRGMLREVSDHLEDAVAAYRRAGQDYTEAEQRAVADFGTVAQVAPGFQTTLALASARRTALMLLAALSIQPFLWDAGINLGERAHATSPDTLLYRVLDSVVEVGGTLGLLGAVVTVALTAIGQRWLRVGRRSAQIAAWYALAAAVLVPAVGIAMLLLTSDATATLLLLAAVFMVAPLTAAGISARRTLATC